MRTACFSALALGALLFLSAPASAQRRGSIYDAQHGPIGLVANKTARKVGDLLTIRISEVQNLRNEERSDLQRQTDLQYALTNFNIKPNAFDPLPALGATSADAVRGTANYEKRGNFTARVTAVVVDVLPNGNLVVRGKREIRIDRETKLIEFSGVVRRYDVGADNSISSELVADAKVLYLGSGPLTEATNRYGLGGWMRSALGWFWPF